MGSWDLAQILGIPSGVLSFSSNFTLSLLFSVSGTVAVEDEANVIEKVRGRCVTRRDVHRVVACRVMLRRVVSRRSLAVFGSGWKGPTAILASV